MAEGAGAARGAVRRSAPACRADPGPPAGRAGRAGPPEGVPPGAPARSRPEPAWRTGRAPVPVPRDLVPRPRDAAVGAVRLVRGSYISAWAHTVGRSSPPGARAALGAGRGAAGSRPYARGVPRRRPRSGPGGFAGLSRRPEAPGVGPARSPGLRRRPGAPGGGGGASLRSGRRSGRPAGPDGPPSAGAAPRSGASSCPAPGARSAGGSSAWEGGPAASAGDRRARRRAADRRRRTGRRWGA